MLDAGKKALRGVAANPMPWAIILGGAASQYRFVKEFPDAAEYIMDCNHWYNPTKPLSQAFTKKVAEKGWELTYEIMRPEDVGLVRSNLVMGKHSGRAAFRSKLEEMGAGLHASAAERPRPMP